MRTLYRLPPLLASFLFVLSLPVLTDTDQLLEKGSPTTTARMAPHFSTYLGGTNIEVSSAIALDDKGYV